MWRVAPLLLLVGVVLAGCSGPSSPDAGSGAGDTVEPGTLRCVVVDEAIRPLPGVNVTLSTGAWVVTESDGLCRFDGLEPGAYVLRAQLAGYADTTTTVTVLSSEATPIVRLVLIADFASLPYSEAYSHEGFVECSFYWSPGGYRFAACGAANLGTLIVCNATGQLCLGNVTADRYITILALDGTPQWLQTESFWESTQSFGSEFYILIGSATPEQLGGSVPGRSVYNDTRGPSPLLATMDAEDLADSGIGAGSYFLAQTFAAPSGVLPPCTPGTPCVAFGAVVQQKFQLILHAFHGYDPPTGWRFSENPAVPPPAL